MTRTARLPTDPCPDAPPGARLGPHPVGVRTVEAIASGRLDVLRLGEEDDPRTDRRLTLEVWYPAAAAGQPTTYEDVLQHDDDPRPYRFPGRGTREAPPLAGPHPLVIVAHGYPGSRVFMTWLTEALASHGYVVVAPDFPSSTHAEFGDRASTLLDRPLDILFVLEHVAARAADPSSWLHGVVDPERTGVVGYSMGGYGALNAAGAGFKGDFVSWPDSVPKGALSVRATGDPAFEASHDPRIRCVAALAPWGAHAAWDPPDVAALRVPLLLVAGDRDPVAGFDPGVVSLFRWAVRAPRHLLVLRGASHALGANPPPPEARHPDDWAHYAEPLWDKARLHDTVRHFIVRFVDRHLRDEGPGLPGSHAPDGRVEQGIAAEEFNPALAHGFELYAGEPLRERPPPRIDDDPVLPSLPAEEPDLESRSAALEAERQTWRYNHAIYGPLAMADAVPDHDQFPFGWLVANLRVLGELVENSAHAAHAFDPSRPLDPAVLVAARQARDGNFDDPKSLLAQLQQALEAQRLQGRPRELSDYERLFQSIKRPGIAYTFLSADAFADTFVAGADPLILRQAHPAGEAAAFADALRSALPASDDPERAWAEGRVFEVNLRLLRGMRTGQHGASRKHLPAPYALFVVSDGRLAPVGIRITESSPVLTPADDARWHVAMAAVRVADASVSALWFHHARTHMVIEPIVLSVRRQLAPHHPVRVLLEPHFVGTLAINRAGQVTVFAEGGAIETVGAAIRPAFRQLAIDAVTSLRFRDLEPRRAFGERGVLDPAALPDFPFRDDALALWDAIGTWVTAYLALYYPDDAAVAGDPELQAFVAEVEDAEGGRLRGVGPVHTLSDLAEVVSIVIFTSSALHWALNGPLRTEMTFVPNLPLAAYADPEVTAELLPLLPPLDQAQRQFEAAYGMGSTRYGQLGVYPDEHFADPRVAPLLACFRADLDKVEAAIRARNAVRERPYEMLLPSLVPASINI